MGKARSDKEGIADRRAEWCGSIVEQRSEMPNRIFFFERATRPLPAIMAETERSGPQTLLSEEGQDYVVMTDTQHAELLTSLGRPIPPAIPMRWPTDEEFELFDHALRGDSPAP